MKKWVWVLFFILSESVMAQGTPVMQTLTGDTELSCPQDVTLTLQGSEVGFDYYLRNENTGSTVDGPLAGTGGPLDFQTGLINTSSHFHVYALPDTANDNTALDFDGIDDFVETNAAVIPSAGDFSVTFLVKRNTTSFSGNEHFFAQGGSTNAVFLGLTNGNIIRAGNQWQNTGFSYPADTYWHHVALVKATHPDSANFDVSLYFDGVLVAAQVDRPYNNPDQEPLRMARQYGQFGEYLNGQLDQFTVWNKALDANEVIETQSTEYVGNEPNLLAYFDFNEGTGTTLNNLANNSNNGTLINMDTTTDWVAGISDETVVSNTHTITFSPVAHTVYVDLNAAGNNDGTSWADAFTSINPASDYIDTLCFPHANDEIHIAQGYYLVFNGIEINHPITIKGGFPTGGGPQDIDSYNTLLSGGEIGRVLKANHNYGTLYLEGLVVTEGLVEFTNPLVGAGIYTVGDLNLDRMEVRYNEIRFFSNNNNDARGAGIYSMSGNITVKNSQIVNNQLWLDNYGNGSGTVQSISYGAGVYTESGNITLINSYVKNNTIRSNSKANGPVTFESSLAVARGGGVATIGGEVTLINSEVSDNLTISKAESDPSFTSFAQSWGGGIYNESGSTHLINSLVSHNTVSASTQSSYFFSDARGGIYGNTVLDNSILWGNMDIEIVNDVTVTETFNEHESGDLFTTHSLIKGADLSATHGIDASVVGFDPLFVDENSGDFRLQVDSPLVDVGDSGLLPADDYDLDGDNDYIENIPHDLDGQVREIGSNVDIGPYEKSDLIFRSGFEL